MSIDLRFRLQRDEFSLDIDQSLSLNGVTAIFGPSGCGKTTLLRAIAGLEHIPGGYLKVGDQLWQDDGMFLPPHRRAIGYVFQEPSLFAHLSVQGNLEYGRKRLNGTRVKVSLEQAVELLGINHLLQRMPHQLSGGEQQRVAIARALAVNPDMLLMDEPLAALDQQRKQEILPYLESLHRELDIPLLYVSHSRNEVARLADQLLLLEEGRVKALGGVGELFSRLDLSLAHDDETDTLIEAVVTSHDEAYGLAYLDFDGGRFAVSGVPYPEQSRVRLQVMARDVSLTLERQQNTSILNIFPAVIDQIVTEQSARVTVRLMLGSTPMLTRITRKSADELGLKQGMQVYAQIKSVALVT